jgi:glycosyltransferase involved in cell wall biosynthesis
MRKKLDLDQKFVWLAIGRFEDAKDYPLMLRAFSQGEAEKRDAVLVLVGDGSKKEQAENLARELGLASWVLFLGERRDILELYNAADAYVMSSAWEGMPNVLLQAAATGLPIVATNVGGNREVIVDGQTGFLVPPKNPTALTGAMRRLMNLPPAARQAIGQSGRAYVKAYYSLDRVVDRWERLYMELLKKRAAC